MHRCIAGSDTYPFSKDQTVQFLRLYKKEQLLWDSNLPEYTDRAKRREAHQRIADHIGLEGLQARHIRLKIRSYREMFTRERKKYTKDSPNKPNWMRELKFLECLKKGSEVYPNDEQDIIAVDNLEENSYFFSEQEDSIEIKQESGSEKDTDIFIQEDTSCPGIQDGVPAKKAKLLENQEAVPSTSNTQESLLACIEKNQTEMLNILKTQQNKASKEDYLDDFAKYIANLLRSLPRSQAFSLQPKIVAMITAEHVKIASRTESIHGDGDQ